MNQLKTSQPAISVIVPVYNAESSIIRSIDSLLAQTFQNFEVIIIDDGSTDSTKLILENHLSSIIDHKCDIIFKSRENKGVAATRNEGVELAKGLFIIHMDSDDWVEKNFLSSLYDSAISQKADIVISDYTLVFDNEKKRIKVPMVSTPVELIRYLLQGKIHGFSWNKLIRSEIIKSNNIVFNDNVQYLEDLVYVIRVALVSNRLSFVNESLIYYNQVNESSITSKLDDDKAQSIIESVKDLCRHVQLSSFGRVLLPETENYKLLRRYFFLSKYDSKLSSEFYRCFSEVDGSLFSCNLSLNKKIFLLINKICGYKFTILLIRMKDRAIRIFR